MDRARSAAVAQGTHNPLVVGSNPTGPIANTLHIEFYHPRVEKYNVTVKANQMF